MLRCTYVCNQAVIILDNAKSSYLQLLCGAVHRRCLCRATSALAPHHFGCRKWVAYSKRGPRAQSCPCGTYGTLNAEYYTTCKSAEMKTSQMHSASAHMHSECTLSLCTWHVCCLLASPGQPLCVQVSVPAHVCSARTPAQDGLQPNSTLTSPPA